MGSKQCLFISRAISIVGSFAIIRVGGTPAAGLFFPGWSCVYLYLWLDGRFLILCSFVCFVQKYAMQSLAAGQEGIA